jgi:hypothetical protein
MSWSGLTAVARAISAVMVAEILLAFFIHGYSDHHIILVIIIISILLALFGCYKFEEKNDGTDVK